MAEILAPDGVDLLRVTCQDINPVAVDMCYINMVLWGIPAKVILGDTLRGTVLRSWTNVHWHRVGEDQRLLLLRIKDAFLDPNFGRASAETGEREEPNSEGPVLQGEFDLDLGLAKELSR